MGDNGRLISTDFSPEMVEVARRRGTELALGNVDYRVIDAERIALDSGSVDARVIKLPLATNARAKMQNVQDGFVKLFCSPGTGIVTGGVVVAPRPVHELTGETVAELEAELWAPP